MKPNASVANWKRRTQLIEYCVGVVDQSIEEKKKGIEDESLDPSSRRQMQAEMYGEEVKVSCDPRRFLRALAEERASNTRCAMN